MLACTVVEYGTWKSTLIWKLLRRLDLHLDTKIIVAGNRKRRINIWRLIAIETTALCLNEARFKATKVNNLGCKASNNTSSIFIHLFVCIYDTVREYSEVAIYLNFNFPGVVLCVRSFESYRDSWVPWKRTFLFLYFLFTLNWK